MDKYDKRYDLDEQVGMLERCPDCGSPMIEKREDRGNGLVEYVQECPDCGLTFT